MRGEDPAKAYTSNFAAGGTAAGAANIASRLAPGPLKLPAALAAGFFSYGPAVDMFKGLYDKASEMFSGASGGPGVDKNLLSQPIQSKVSDIAFKSGNLMGDEKKLENKSNLISKHHNKILINLHSMVKLI